MKTIKKIGVIGGGVIGLPWTALFLAKGYQVTLYDNATNYQAGAKAALKKLLTTLNTDFDKVKNNLVMATQLSELDESIDLIQENGPENLAIKQSIFKELERYTRTDIPYLSSSSGIMPTPMAETMAHPERLAIGHPYNPPHIIPLVEVVAGTKTSPEIITFAMNFYEEIGKVPVLVKKEMSGHAANRLQIALFQEAVYLVEQDVLTIEDVDKIIESSLGVRWATTGPYKSFHLGGGPTGFAGFLTHFTETLNYNFANTGKVQLNNELADKLIKQTESTYGMDLAALSHVRDVKQGQVIDLMKEEVE